MKGMGMSDTRFAMRTRAVLDDDPINWDSLSSDLTWMRREHFNEGNTIRGS